MDGERERFEILYQQGKILSERVQALSDLVMSTTKRLHEQINDAQKELLDVWHQSRMANIKLDALMVVNGLQCTKTTDTEGKVAA